MPALQSKVVAIGEILWDLLPDGPRIGGAPANFAMTAHELGADAHLVSRVAADQRGQEIRTWLESRNFPAETVQVDWHAPTGTVGVTIGSDGQPQYDIHTAVAWDYLAVDEPGVSAVYDADAVCFGTLGQRSERSRNSIRRLLASSPMDAFRLLDVNLRPPFDNRDILRESLGFANALKVNEAELPIVAELFGRQGTPAMLIGRLVERLGLRLLIHTRGSEGSIIYFDNQWSELPADPVQVVDSVGAGDAFAAAVLVGLLRKRPLEAVHRHATAVAGYVCTRPGAAPPIPRELRQA